MKLEEKLDIDLSTLGRQKLGEMRFSLEHWQGVRSGDIHLGRDVFCCKTYSMWRFVRATSENQGNRSQDSHAGQAGSHIG